MKYNFSSMQIEGDDIGELEARRRPRPTDPDRIRFSSGDVVEEKAPRRKPAPFTRQSLLNAMGETEFGIPVDGTDDLDIAPVSNPFSAGRGPMISRSKATIGSLNAYDEAAYKKFMALRTGTYSDGVVSCKKDSRNRPACRFTHENTADKRRSGTAARMQRAADAFLNKVPLFQNLHMSIPVSGEKASEKAVMTAVLKLAGEGLPNPIGKRAGYDGWVGPSTFGLTMLALAIASDLNPDKYTAGVVDAVNGLNEATLTANAGEVADFLESTTENFDSLLDAYKSDPPPSPLLVPKSIKLLKKRDWVKPVAFAAGLGFLLFAAFGKKYDKMAEEEEMDQFSPGKAPMSGSSSGVGT